ncbi:MAG: GIY-YIG nuclease family protein [Faecousia sp.]
MSIYKSGRPNKYNPTSGVGQKPPAKPGEYRMRDGSGTITYIGETNNLARRTGEHIRSGKLPVGEGCNSTIEYMVADGRSTSRTRREHEQQSIAKHAPTLNRSKGGEGRPAGR